MQAGILSRINKHAGGNKAMQVGIFQTIDNMCSRFIRYSRVLNQELLKIRTEHSH